LSRDLTSFGAWTLNQQLGASPACFLKEMSVVLAGRSIFSSENATRLAIDRVFDHVLLRIAEERFAQRRRDGQEAPRRTRFA
jgi:hypothetical protein